MGRCISARTGHKCAATPAAGPGMTDDLDDLTIEYWRIVQRVRETPLLGIDKASLLAEIEAAHRAISEAELAQRRVGRGPTD